MADDFGMKDFGSSEKLLDYIKEKSDDVEKVVIVGKGAVLAYCGVPQAEFTETKMMFVFVGGERFFIGKEDAEIVLNDGILNRMKIKIEFFG